MSRRLSAFWGIWPAAPRRNIQNRDMKVVILAGGLGTRLREETEFRPKPMVEIGGRPILWHLMKFFAFHSVTDFVVPIGYRGEVIRDYFINYEARTTDFTICLGSPHEL